jgi:hypothetical protein
MTIRIVPVVLLPAVLLPALLFTSVASGQQLSDMLRVTRQGLHFNARSLGLGNAYSTVGYDFTALRFNPATMAVNKDFSWSVSANANSFSSQSNYYGSRVDFRTTNATGGQTGLTIPFKFDSTRTLMVGLGYTQSKDFNVGYRYAGLNEGTRFPSFIEALTIQGDPTARALGLSYPTYDGSGNYIGDRTILGAGMYERGNLLDQGGLTHFTFGAALEAVPGVFFGASGSYNTGHSTSDLELSASDPNDVFPSGVRTDPNNPQTDAFTSADYRAVRDKRYTGWDGRFGILYRWENLIGLSASFKVPNPHKVTEDLFVSGTSYFDTTRSIIVAESKTTTSYSLRPPTEMTMGAMVNLWILTGTAEASYVDYSAMQLTSGAGGASGRTRVNKRIKDELGSVLNVNVGTEFRLPFTGLSARAGAIYQPSPYKLDPSRFAQKVITLGAGINSDNAMQFDIGYAYGWRGENKNLQTDNVQSAEQTVSYHTVLFTMRLAL